ncbi:early nodulin-like protein 1 [Gastrolobium bilobum]|uniref:early nodulin-like protein 1 n=1 Tax=Gastrolobium bilobum TaxID=150636 RepID=UPI002AB23414|nr:early nodulin-like protein 1 [Gastrolobium bilobum]XP_061360630.1 early nodulin-like protein 1 [Gastrolobium bilobum]
MVGFGNIISNQFLRLLLLMIPMLLFSSSSSSQAAAKEFSVGGKDGWVVEPSEYYNQRAQENRFHVNGIIYFKYKKGDDSVLVVKKEDYFSCNNNNPIHKMDGGNSTFLLDRLGHFFFISGNVDSCKNGQKLIIFVNAVRDTVPQATPQSQSSTSVPHEHGGGDGRGWSVRVNRSCTRMCCNFELTCDCC